MPVLISQQRKILEDACTKGRRASEQAVRAALTSLAITAERPPAHLDDDERQLRRGLRAKARQLGDKGDNIDLLVAECAYEQWHRLLFARFLAENNLLIHPKYHAPVTLEDCEELAEELGEPDGWSVAARFAAEILPGIFRLDDPCVRLRLAPEGRLALEGILAGLPADVFVSDDALGWVYQFWQKDKKDEVNAAERKIGGPDLAPVTQLFTENYMVRFLLENSLGAWWAARHPDSPLVKEFDYLRFDEEGSPAAGTFEGWPDRVAEVTVMDPCCGSGHFLVVALSMLWQMHAEEDGLSPADAQDDVLRANLFGLELDPRCVQIAMFAVALQAWKTGGAWRELPIPNIACSGIPVRTPVDEWRALANGDRRLEDALVRLHILFRDADTLGSLINPRQSAELSDGTGLQRSLEDVDWDDVAPILQKAARAEEPDSATAVLGADAAGIARAADFLSRHYTLVATNPPFLGSGKQSGRLSDFVGSHLPEGAQDLATSFLQRSILLIAEGGCAAFVSPQNWLNQSSYEGLRTLLLRRQELRFIVALGEEGFESFGVRGPRALLTISVNRVPVSGTVTRIIDASAPPGKQQVLIPEKIDKLRCDNPTAVLQATYMDAPGRKISLREQSDLPLLRAFAYSVQGLKTGDNARFVRFFWELSAIADDWNRLQGAVGGTVAYGGRQEVVWWQNGEGELALSPQARIQGQSAWTKQGVLVREMRDLSSTLYTGDMYQSNGIAIVPRSPSELPALWSFVSSPEFSSEVRALDSKLGVATSSVVDVPFDVERWHDTAGERFHDGLPEPWSDDPSQWLFEGRPDVSIHALQVAVARLVGYRWPEQPADDLDVIADADGIVCLPSVAGEPPASDRLEQLLGAAFGAAWSPAKQKELLETTGSKKKHLSDWLRDEFFKQHCAVFEHRPFVWHIWDGQRDGFAALVNYHRLDRRTLEKLTYTYLGDWIERQRADVRDEVAGAEARVAAAAKLRMWLELILEGDPPHDIYVRWKSLAEQPIGWDPDVNDGVRLNIRPFVKAGVLRSKVNVKWGKDRGKNPDGSERHNDLHLTTGEKRAARGGTA